MRMIISRRQSACCYSIAFVCLWQSAAQAQSVPTPNCRIRGSGFHPAQNDTINAGRPWMRGGVCTSLARAEAVGAKEAPYSLPHRSLLPREMAVVADRSLRFTYKPKVGFKGNKSCTIKICGTNNGGSGCSTLIYKATVQ
jgi:hypothetical protein